jgi:hypothetical protein
VGVGDGVGDGVGVADGEGLGAGDEGVGEAVGPLAGVFDACWLLLPQPAVNNRAATIAHKIRKLKPDLNVEFIDPPKTTLEVMSGATLLAPGIARFTV